MFIHFSVRECELALNMVSGIGKKRYAKLIKHFGDAKSVFNADVFEISMIDDIGKVTARSIKDFDVNKELELELELIQKNNIKTIHLYDEDYPKNLKTIYDPPPVLYVKGEFQEADEISIAVIGTRVPTQYGKLVAKKLTKELVSAGFVIVSGLARGIDTIAHKAALENGGRTLSVLGSGILNVYPPENLGLAKQISETGVLISEFNLLKKPDKNNFPSRNRIVAGLTQGTLVVEAPEKSGALITADFAMEYGREVFAVPGPIHSPKSRGGNTLI
ncbi:MAG: DNA-protecting protein DprA, partial [Nitrospinae bacterium]|nr:DNA-protecting protein DprA [Nitrospinota bacterium]